MTLEQRELYATCINLYGVTGVTGATYLLQKNPQRRLEAIAVRLEANKSLGPPTCYKRIRRVGWRPSLLGWRPVSHWGHLLVIEESAA